MCRDPDLNWGHLPLQGSALPTELSRQLTNSDYITQKSRKNPVF